MVSSPAWRHQEIGTGKIWGCPGNCLKDARKKEQVEIFSLYSSFCKGFQTCNDIIISKHKIGPFKVFTESVFFQSFNSFDNLLNIVI